MPINAPKKTVIHDCAQDIASDIFDAASRFIRVMKYVDALCYLQDAEGLAATLESAVFGKALALLREAGKSLPPEAGRAFEGELALALGGRIYDLISLAASAGSGREQIELVIGKIFSSEKENRGRYAGAVGMVNGRFDGLISSYDAKLDFFLERLPAPAHIRGASIKESAPLMRCLDVIALAGELNRRHKPICVFFSGGGGGERLSTLSQMTVFLNVYVERFKLISRKIAEKHLCEYSLVEPIGDMEIAAILLLWLRGHDLGHFWGVDALSPKMSEFDRDYFALHELKSDAISLYNLRFLSGDLLPGDLLRAAYVSAVAEMFRYLRRAEGGDFFQRPDTASALLAYRWLADSGAIRFDAKLGRLRLDFARFEAAIERLAAEMLRIFAGGGVDAARAFVRCYSRVDDSDIAFERVMRDTEIPHYIDFHWNMREVPRIE
ncbi:MAG: hypothetical protein ACT4NX_01600 [Deltaproteobacteria bacterium]